MKRMINIKKFILLTTTVLILAACTPTESVVQTAIAKTLTAAPTASPTGMSNQELIQTAVIQTLTPAAATASAGSSSQIQTVVIQTLTAIVPTQTATPLISPTPLTPTPSITSTHKPWPTITNTPEPYIPSGPITLTDVIDMGNNSLRLNWQAQGSFPDGFYVLWSPSNSEPSYPNDYWYYFVNGHARSGVIDVKQAKTYYFRVCEFNAEKKQCGNYSNAIQFTNQ